MGTTEEPQEPEEKDSKSFDFHDYVDKGKKWAATVVVLVAFLQSLYASYIKDEDVAKETYTVQKTAMEEFADEVDISLDELEDQVAFLQGQVDVLKAALPGETLAALAIEDAAAAALDEDGAEDGPNLVQVNPDPQMSVEEDPLEQIRVEEDLPPELLEELKKAKKRKRAPRGDKRPEQRHIKIDLPDAPWEQRK